MNPKESKDFLALPEPHHHVSRLLIIVLFLAVIIALSWIYKQLSYRPNYPVEPYKESVSVVKDKVITDEELTDIANKLNIGGAKGLPPTNEELQKISNLLNKK